MEGFLDLVISGDRLENLAVVDGIRECEYPGEEGEIRVRRTCCCRRSQQACKVLPTQQRRRRRLAPPPEEEATMNSRKGWWRSMMVFLQSFILFLPKPGYCINLVTEEHIRRHFRFDAIVISSEVGYEKPSTEIFRAALDQIGLEASNAVHVGDVEKADRDGANAIGVDCWLWGSDVNTFAEICDRIIISDSLILFLPKPGYCINLVTEEHIRRHFRLTRKSAWFFEVKNYNRAD